jgi:hypothetical protein
MHPLIHSVGVIRPSGRLVDRPYSTCLAKDTDIVIASSMHTSSANAYMSAFHLLMREAILKQMPETKWKEWGGTIPEAALAILQHTGKTLVMPRKHNWNLTVAQLDAALSFVFGVAADKQPGRK